MHEQEKIAWIENRYKECLFDGENEAIVVFIVKMYARIIISVVVALTSIHREWTMKNESFHRQNV